MIDQDIQDGIHAARNYAKSLMDKLDSAQMAATGFGGPPNAEETLKNLRLVYRMGTELCRKVDHLGQVLVNREHGT